MFPTIPSMYLVVFFLNSRAMTASHHLQCNERHHTSRNINTASDALYLQRDLDNLVTWVQERQMTFHPSKCYVLHIYRIKNPTIHHYTTLDQTLKAVDHQPYLSITISETRNWKTHVLDVKNKANRNLGCIKRNLQS